MPTEQSTVDKYKSDLTANLLETCTGSGLLKGTLLDSPDIDEQVLFSGEAVPGEFARVRITAAEDGCLYGEALTAPRTGPCPGGGTCIE